MDMEPRRAPEDLAPTPVGRPLPAHGTRARYQRGCGCVPCRAANSQYEIRRRRVPRPCVAASRAKRLLHCLWLEGYSRQAVARAFGTQRPPRLRRRRVAARTLDAIERVYQRLVLD